MILFLSMQIQQIRVNSLAEEQQQQSHLSHSVNIRNKERQPRQPCDRDGWWIFRIHGAVLAEFSIIIFAKLLLGTAT